jgi:hypothetical protein
MNERKPTPRRAHRITLGLTALATTVLIAACGSSSSSSTNTTSSSTPAASASAGTTAGRSTFVKCLQQHGVTLPARAPGSGGSPTHSGPPPAGSSGAGSGSSTRQAAFKACGATGQRAPAG